MQLKYLDNPSSDNHSLVLHFDSSKENLHTKLLQESVSSPLTVVNLDHPNSDHHNLVLCLDSSKENLHTKLLQESVSSPLTVVNFVINHKHNDIPENPPHLERR